MTQKPFMNTIERLPINIVGGAGSRLIDDNGNSYLDFWGDEGVASLGYCTPIVQDVFNKFAHTNTPHRLPDAYPSDIRTKAAAALTRMAKFDQVFFCNSGAEANEAMIKLARRYWSKVRGSEHHKRFHILTLEGNFHGRSGYALAASDSIDSPYHKQGYGPTPPGFGVIHDDLDITRVRRWDSDSEMYKADDALKWSQVAAITMAPILGNNVVKTYPQAFWEKLEALRAKHGFLVMFDEVQVAMGRATTFCAHHNPAVTYGFRPDIVAIGKGIAGGLPAAVVMADDEVAQAFVPGVHFSTFGGTIIVCEMMLEVCAWIENNKDSLKQREAQFKNGLENLQLRGLISAYDGAGVHWGFTPNYDKGKMADHAINSSTGQVSATGRTTFTGMDVCDQARRRGLLLLTHRPKAPIRFTPPLNINERDLSEAFTLLEQTLRVFVEV